MNLTPTYEMQNRWIIDYLYPFLSLDFGRFVDNYRRNKARKDGVVRRIEIEEVIEGWRNPIDQRSFAWGLVEINSRWIGGHGWEPLHPSFLEGLPFEEGGLISLVYDQKGPDPTILAFTSFDVQERRQNPCEAIVVRRIGE